MEKPATIKGIKMKLVTISPSDAQHMVDLRNNPAYNRFLSNANDVITLEHQLKWMDNVMGRQDCIDFKVATINDEAFCGTIALYDIEDGAAEFGRYMAVNPIAAIESEYLILKFGFEVLGLKRIYCNTVKANTKVWQQHTKYGFRKTGEDFDSRIRMERVCQEITADEFRDFDYRPILSIVERL